MADSLAQGDSQTRDDLMLRFTNKRLFERLEKIEKDHDALQSTHRTMSKELKERTNI